MRPELDFRTLRAQIEAATLMPDFSTLYRRAGRVRIRDRMAVAGALVGTLAVFAPVVLAGMFGRPSPTVLGPNPDLGEPWSPGASVAPSATSRHPSTTTVRAVAGDLPDGMVAAVDVCVDAPQARRCSLQVTMLRDGSAERRTPFVFDALRKSPLDKLDHVELTRISPETFLLSGEVSGGSRTCVRFKLSDATATALPGQSAAPVLGPNDRLSLSGTDRAVQLVQYGDLFGVRHSDGSLSLLASQPPMAQRTLVTGLSTSAGWWVTGADLRTGAPSVAVSTDQGRSWRARTLDAPAGIDVPTLATVDGKSAYALVPYRKGIRLFRTDDGGGSWYETRAKIELPPPLDADDALNGREFGMLVRPDRSVLLWVQGASETVFLESVDGDTFKAVVGPGGPLTLTDNGYASLGDPPRVSQDARTWQEATLSATVLPN
jgi:hypothetical protein